MLSHKQEYKVFTVSFQIHWPVLTEKEVTGTFVPGNESSIGETIVAWYICPQKPSLLGTFIPWNFCSQHQN